MLPVDVADADQVEEAATRTETELGEIDVWVNDAFTSVFSPFDQIEPAEYKRVTEVSYLGYVYGTMAALRRMKPRDRGAIVQVGSALAYRGIPLQTAYCGAKHAIQGFTESLRCELLHEKSNVHVTMVQMPAVNTPQFSWVLSRLPRHPQPVPPIYQPEVAAKAVLHAADHPQRREYWVGSTTAATLAANALMPGLLDRYLGRTGVRRPADPAAARPGRAGQPLGAGRPRPGLRRARHLRRHVAPAEQPAVGQPAPRRGRRRARGGGGARARGLAPAMSGSTPIRVLGAARIAVGGLWLAGLATGRGARARPCPRPGGWQRSHSPDATSLRAHCWCPTRDPVRRRPAR